MGKKLSKAPVFYVVSQVQFNPVLNIESFLASIQESMRKAGFVDFKHEIVQQLIIRGQENPPMTSPQNRYVFGDLEATTGFVLSNNALALQTCSYETFEDFSGKFMTGMEIIHEALSLAFVERIGLRYLDAVQPSEGEQLSQYMAPEVLGLAHKLNTESLSHSFSETVFSHNGSGQLVSRVLVRNGSLALPQDLASPSAPQINTRFTEIPPCIHSILDTDAFFIRREKFDLGSISKRLETLHGEIRKVFELLVTKYALNTWA